MGNWTDIHIDISSVFLYNKLRNIVARFISCHQRLHHSPHVFSVQKRGTMTIFWAADIY